MTDAMPESGGALRGRLRAAVLLWVPWVLVVAVLAISGRSGGRMRPGTAAWTVLVVGGLGHVVSGLLALRLARARSRYGGSILWIVLFWAIPAVLVGGCGLGLVLGALGGFAWVE